MNDDDDDESIDIPRQQINSIPFIKRRVTVYRMDQIMIVGITKVIQIACMIMVIMIMVVMSSSTSTSSSSSSSRRTVVGLLVVPVMIMAIALETNGYRSVNLGSDLDRCGGNGNTRCMSMSMAIGIVI